MKVLLLSPLLLLLLVLLHPTPSQGNSIFPRPDEDIVKRSKREGFFRDLDDPLKSMRRSFQGLTSNVEKSMKTFMSAISHGMKSFGSEFYRRTPRLVPVPSYTSPSSSYAHPDSYEVHELPIAESVHSAELIYPHTNHLQQDCNCSDYGPFVPVSSGSEYRAPLQSVNYIVPNPSGQYGAPIQPDQYGAPISSNEYGAPIQPDQYGAPIQSEQYGAPISNEEYGAPISNEEYGAPISNEEYGAPISNEEYGAPISNEEYGPPISNEEYGAPISNEEYGAPHVSVFGAPKPLNIYVAPQQPTDVYGAPQNPRPAVIGSSQTSETYGAPFTSGIVLIQPPSNLNPSEEYGSPEPYREYGAPQTSPGIGTSSQIPQPTFQHESQPFLTSGSSSVQYTTTVQTPTETYEVPRHWTDQEICQHLRALKEDVHSAPVDHAGGSNDVDIHKLETIGVHSTVQKSSAVVPDQSHPEKYISVDCKNVKQVVNHRLYYIDTKPLKAHLKGHQKVREATLKI